MKNKVKSGLFIAAVAYSIFFIINIASVVFIKMSDNFGFADTVSIYNTFIGPLIFSIGIFIFYFLGSKKRVIFFLPIALLVLKLILIGFSGYNVNNADFILNISIWFSDLFNLFHFFLQKSSFHSALTEILLHVFLLCIYQVSVLFFALKFQKTFFDKVS